MRLSKVSVEYMPELHVREGVDPDEIRLFSPAAKPSEEDPPNQPPDDREALVVAPSQDIAKPTHRQRKAYRVIRSPLWVVLALLLVIIALSSFTLWKWHRERLLRSADIGRFKLRVSIFSHTGKAIPRPYLPDLELTLFRPDPSDPSVAGDPISDATYRWLDSSDDSDEITGSMLIEARSGPAFLRIAGRSDDGRPCRPSWIRIKWLPGYVDRTKKPMRELPVALPSCEASSVGMKEIPAGEFYKSGPGEPALQNPELIEEEKVVNLLAFKIDEHEVTNAKYREFVANTAPLSGANRLLYPNTFEAMSGDDHPAAAIAYQQARDYCRYLGQDLPTSEQWEKAARGGLHLGPGRRNPHPRRNFPWGIEKNPLRANLVGDEDGHADLAPVTAPTTDISPYGVRHLAGNVLEWTRTPSPESGFYVVRGGDAFTAEPDSEQYYLSNSTIRSLHQLAHYGYGFRCVAEPVTR